jgi:hypothetical protein
MLRMQDDMWNVNWTWTLVSKLLFQFKEPIFDVIFDTRRKQSFCAN